jgi:exodeoxyribonuclease V alpha subunit
VYVLGVSKLKSCGVSIELILLGHDYKENIKENKTMTEKEINLEATEDIDPKDLFKEYENKNPKLMQNLRLVGLGEIMSAHVVSHFSLEKTGKIIFEENPYRLMEVDGISFTKADKIAKFLSVEDEDPRRQRALIQKAMEDNKNFGHAFLPITILEKALRKEKVINYEEHLKELVKSGDLVVDDNRIYSRLMWRAEGDVATSVVKRKRLFPEIMGKAVDLEERSGDIDQAQAISSFPQYGILVITGGPGTGKTFTIDSICERLERNGYKFALCAPTGKAAKRLQDLTGKPAKTIHRLLKAGFGTWKHNHENPLRGFNWVICDESSMLDLELAWRLTRALPTNTRLIFVGDVDQLPPVGPGTFFKDLVTTESIPTITLRTNHRQGRGSSIANVASHINAGFLKYTFDDDMMFEEAENQIVIREKISPLLQGLLDEGYDLIRDVQVVSPQKGTMVGVYEVNKFLRFHLNKNASTREPFSIGDKVMQTVNNYRLGIFNGYAGVVKDVQRHHLIIDFFDSDKQFIKYPKELLSELMHAFCCTVHKYQGSEAKAGIVILSSSHTFMLTRNLFYTAVTRFKEKCIILGDVTALKRAVTNTRVSERYSKLYAKIEE